MLDRAILLCLLLVLLMMPTKVIGDDWYIYEHDLTTDDLNFIDTSGSFAVGDNGVLLVCLYPITSGSEQYWDELPYWEDISPDTTEDLYGAADRTNVHVVGASGTIIYSEWGGYTWVFIDSPTTKDLYSVTVTTGYDQGVLVIDQGFIVGPEGTILYGGGEPPEWELYQPSPTIQDLYSVSGDDYYYVPNSTWAVGAGGTILDYEDGEWSLYPFSPTTVDLYGVYVYNDSLAFACGAGGTILRWDGTSWNLADTPTTEDLYSIWGKYYHEYCVGANGTILFSEDGFNWVLEDCPVTVDLHGVAGYGVYWAVGDGGTILSDCIVQNIQPTSVGRVKALFAPGVEAVGSMAKVKAK